MPFKVFTNGVPLPASDLNDYLMEQSIATFADSAARAAQLVSPTEGQLTYLADTDLHQYWSGSAWVDFGASQTLLSTTTLTGASVTISSIPQTYKDLTLIVRNFRPSADAVLRARVNGLTTNIYTGSGTTAAGGGNTFWELGDAAQDSTATNFHFNITDFWDYANTTTQKAGQSRTITNDSATPTSTTYRGNTLTLMSTIAISSITLLPSTGTFTSGTALLYGVR